jgi:hypothetical protein
MVLTIFEYGVFIHISFKVRYMRFEQEPHDWGLR